MMKTLICCRPIDDPSSPSAKCLQTVPLPPLLFSDIDLFHLEEEQKGREDYRNKETYLVKMNINMSEHAEPVRKRQIIWSENQNTPF